ncbi:MAG: serine/threonine-protein kinase [Woeseiaceae bacterium]|nr:serine/threonine-protein kinase [Woeseiaceae bacterium]
MRELKSGAQLAGRYTLVRKLGSGGSSETWLANDRLTKAKAALKLKTDDAQSPEALRREWQLSIRLIHAHIVRVFEFHETDDASFYTLQYVDGPDLSVLAGAPWEDVLGPIALIADALRYAHGKDVVHRDLKASNVLLDANGAPYLIDFGVATTGSEDIGGGSLIAASPEQLDGQPPQPSDDIFALGGLIYELIAGRSPYSPIDTENDIRNKQPDALRQADGSPVPPAVQALVADMLAKRAADRPDAAEVVERLESLGVRGSVADRRYLGQVRAIADEEIETAQSVHRPGTGKTGKAGETVRADSSGLSPKLVGGALAVLVALLLAVVFLLPKTVDDELLPPAVEDTTSAETAEEAEEADEADDGTPADEAAPARDERVIAREDAEQVLGELLAKQRTLEGRAVERWGGLPWRQGTEAYEAGDRAYLAQDYATAIERYGEAIELIDPLLDEVDVVFRRALDEAETALDAGDTREAVTLYELAVAISPSHGPARRGLIRAQNLDEVLALTAQGEQLERDLDLFAALQSFERAVEIDPEWQSARDGADRVRETMKQMDFDQRMTEGLTALAEGDYLSARAAFRAAEQLYPESTEPADGLQQVDNALRLNDIASFETQALTLESEERWEAAAEAYASILEIDPNLTFAQEGRARANRMIALHAQLDEFIADPDRLSSDRTMQAATQLVVGITRMPEIGPRLTAQRDELTRLLRRASTPLTVSFESDNLTDVSIYRVGTLGNFDTVQLELRPGTYVAVGSRAGYRDVRVEFRVAPEIEQVPIVVRCEEEI